jgi:hypothetical protein
VVRRHARELLPAALVQHGRRAVVPAEQAEKRFMGPGPGHLPDALSFVEP